MSPFSVSDQQRVLQKSKHEVKFADVRLVLNVRERPTCSPITTPTTSKLVSLKLDSTSSQEPPTLGEEYELQPDTYLLQYLKECPKAWEGLEIELLSLACSAQLYPEEGRVLVSCFTQPGAADYVRNWKAEVDTLFDGYLCHCEVDPHKVVALLESRNSLQTTNDVKVYSENGMAVVVGQRSQVNAKLMDVDALLGKQRPRLLERQTSICRLGEAKLRLLWKEIEHTLPKDFPGVKVTQGAPGAGQVNTTVASYSLRDGLQVLVCQGDISKQEADALVNAANEDLDHGGGVAAALSKAGGPQVQKESRALVKQTGKIPTGDAVVTTGGNLNCKNLVHVVGPVGGKAGGQERVLLEKTVKSALNLAEMMEFRSIAMPCISSGVFGVPVTVCSEAIVTAVKEFCSQGGRSLRRIILIDNRGEVVRSMQDACDRLLQGTSTGNRAPSDLGFQMDASAQYAAREATAGAPGGGVHVEIIQGSIENQQVDGLVSPMVGHDPLSSRVGNFLSNMVGPQLTAKFYNEAGGATIPGEIILVEGLPALQSRGVVFINLTPWDNNQQGTAVQVLRNGIKKMLASCQIRGYSSVALPVLGVGAALRFPHSVAARVIMEEVRQFEHNRITGTSFLVRIIVQSIQSSKAFQSCQDTMHLRGFTNDADPDQASFYRHISATNDEVTASLGGIKLQMAVGVSKAILTAAGPSVQTQLAQVGTPADFMCTTGPGGLACKEIIHASFMRDHEVIRKNCKKILKHCESKGYSSVSFPAVNTGAAHMDLTKACKALLDGMTSAIMDLKPGCLKLIRIVIFQQSVFQAFRSELENRFGQTATRHLSLREKAKQMLKKWQETRTRTTATPKGQIFASSKPPPAVIIVIGCGPDIIRTMKRDLEGILQDQLIEKDVDVEDFSRLDDMEREAVQAKLKVLGVSLEYKKRQSSEGGNGNRAENAARAEARDRSGSGTEVYVLKGLKEDVLTIIELINKAIRKALSEDNQENNEAMLALDVQWSIQDTNKVWRELSLHDNYILEEAHKKKQVFVDITSPDRIKVSVNLKENKATNQLTGITFKVKRNESDTTLVLPTHWEPMHEVDFKKVELQPTSPEYKNIAQGFLQTAKYNIHKIERVQNIYLWYGYTVLKKYLLAKNGTAGDGEKLLYHGTSAESCNCIEKGKFDRNFAGKHAALYGKGVYFAVTAAYSADRFSPADASGMKRLYVAQVLTGRYTIGNSDLKAPPPRGSDKTDCFDSCVDNQQNPSMFVIFHDHQAYPEYLITFS
ncbi:Protein mono-ADP-ribosyltransferase PARP14 [Dissostichus eleginoides]|uniref:Poly [ADP-ribose] polymerase n=1 Tax=Dissostichus eleginoides TaxID=100907 RepID=A0AAD9BWP6_DISEL|nr:Protein mono-ADP-ribosyltransferase PARP14 [Dissostichus eleginoides]KAK1890408.1 Protein mono-ADP-ribosyltransferase PARP14 [Dissostichus eleginoides]